MCAIAGLLGFLPEKSVIGEMLRSMVRRGPDGKGVWQKEDCTLLHTRLAIVDPEGGSQPMTLDWEGERYTLVYNGELYNTEELRQALLEGGHRFLGHSDTEVLLHAWARWGEGCLEKCNGIFAFAIWEERKKRLYLAQDRIGVKPLFYCHRGKELVFASEIKTLFASRRVNPVLDREGITQVLMFGPGRIPGSGVFRGVRELEPGCYARFEGGRLEILRYWQLRDREHRDSFPETVEKVRYLVCDAAKRQMVSDVPLGTFLSGGLDSSILSALCAGEMKNRGQVLKTFSVDYRDNDRHFTAGKFQPNADGEYIRLMNDFLGAENHSTVLTPEDLENALEDATIARDLPGMGDVDFSLLVFCRRIRQDVKVALSGECADEIFGGYPWYRDPEVRAREGFPWAQNTATRAALLHPHLRTGARELVMDHYRRTCRESDVLPGATETERRMKEMMNLNFRWFMQTLLDRKDRMSMFSGLEVRVPFCDWRIAEYLYGVPWEMKDWQGREKGLLRKAMEGLLPHEVLYRKKSPYPKTFDPAYGAAMDRRMDRLLESDSPLFALVDRKALAEWKNTEQVWPWYGQLMTRPQTMAYFLQVDFWLRHYATELAV